MSGLYRSPRQVYDWEAATVNGVGYKQAIVTLAERKSRFADFSHETCKTPSLSAKPYQEPCFSGAARQSRCLQ
jgi:hypothetical protein